MEKDISLIPKGDYCYSVINEKITPCPYWSINSKKPVQENGYCSYMEKGDWDINEESEAYNPKTGEIFDCPIPVGLLWDQIKECDINKWTDEELRQQMDSGEIVASNVTHNPIEPDFIIRKKNESI